MSDKIYFDPTNAQIYQQQLAEASLDDYVVDPPSRASEGQMPAMFDTLAGTMVELYNQVQQLILSSEDMLTQMARKLSKADEGSAVM